jgi:hypothetical protein
MFWIAIVLMQIRIRIPTCLTIGNFILLLFAAVPVCSTLFYLFRQRHKSPNHVFPDLTASTTFKNSHLQNFFFVVNCLQLLNFVLIFVCPFFFNLDLAKMLRIIPDKKPWLLLRAA